MSIFGHFSATIRGKNGEFWRRRGGSRGRWGGDTILGVRPAKVGVGNQQKHNLSGGKCLHFSLIQFKGRSKLKYVRIENQL